MKISILIPCHNEGLAIAACVQSCIDQTRTPDEIIVVNDGSTDNSAEILRTFGNKIKVIHIPVATGNKSYAQERGLKLVSGDIFIATDGDTILNENFVEKAEQDFINDPSITAIGGYIHSIKYNWLTSCRAVEYGISQNIHKVAQNLLGYLFVISGAAGVFKTDDFRRFISFDHDTLTEDLDFTYRFHANNLKITFNKDLIVYTQDPTTLSAYINQMRRWFGGGWQCLLKHKRLIISNPKMALELSLLYAEGIIFSLLLFVLPFLSLQFFIIYLWSYLLLTTIFVLFIAIKDKRFELLLVPIPYMLVMFINSYIFLEQMIKEVVFKKNNLIWFTPERFQVDT